MCAILELPAMALLSILAPFKQPWIRATIPEEEWCTSLPADSF